MKNLIVDLDGTLTLLDNDDYSRVSPNVELIRRLKDYKKRGFNITIATARNMRTFNGDLGKINVHTLPVILEWLEAHDVPFDNIILGKPWCGTEGFYIDDKAIRPSEFLTMELEQIYDLLSKENQC